eukprot:6491358-Amphidinium_carterae.6
MTSSKSNSTSGLRDTCSCGCGCGACSDASAGCGCGACSADASAEYVPATFTFSSTVCKTYFSHNNLGVNSRNGTAMRFIASPKS